jgi:hypothetical protein
VQGGGQGAHEVGDEAGDAGRGRAVGAVAAPHDHLVELDVADRFGGLVGQGRHVLDHEHAVRLVGAAAGVHDEAQAFRLLRQHLVLAAGGGLELGEDGGGLGLGLDATALAGGLGLHDLLGLGGAGGRFQRGAALVLDALGLGQRGLGTGPVLRLLDGGLGNALPRLALLVGFSLPDLQPALAAAIRA